jgi:hypothetical protein
MIARTQHTKHDSQPWQTLFLASLAETGSVRAATRMAGISHTHAYNERTRDPAFACSWDAVRATTKRVGRSSSHWQSVFLATLAASGNVSVAVRVAGTSRANVYATRRRDRDFAAAWAYVLADRYARQAEQNRSTSDDKLETLETSTVGTTAARGPPVGT